MKNKHFSKKKILGIIKTYHAKSRQKDRFVSDKMIQTVLEKGTLDYIEQETPVVRFNGIQVILTHDLEKILTVTSPYNDDHKFSSKALSENDAIKIKDAIKKNERPGKKVIDQQENEEEQEQDIDFAEYMNKHYPPKK